MNPVGNSTPSRKRRWAWAVLAAAGLGLAVLVTTATLDGLVYYRTPSEVLSGPRDDAVVRVGGYVVPGSIVRDDTLSTLVVADEHASVTVHYEGPLPSVVQEGEGAVVEGTWGQRQVIVATEVLLRHSNEYRAPQVGGP